MRKVFEKKNFKKKKKTKNRNILSIYRGFTFDLFFF